MVANPAELFGLMVEGEGAVGRYSWKRAEDSAARAASLETSGAVQMEAL